MGVTANAPYFQLTYRIIGPAMEVHNELGPGHREADYHDALHIKLKNAGLNFLDEPEVLITLDSGEVVKARRPDFVVEDCVIVELKGRPRLEYHPCFRPRR